MSKLLLRERHPIADPHVAAQNALLVCRPRGYCGPFINQEYYNAFPDSLWNGKGDCVLCGSTRDVAREEALRDRVLRG